MTGLHTFLFTDIEGSTRRWEADADAMRAALAAHDEVLREAITVTAARSSNTPAMGCARCSPHRAPPSTPRSAQRALELPVRMGIAHR